MNIKLKIRKEGHFKQGKAIGTRPMNHGSSGKLLDACKREVATYNNLLGSLMIVLYCVINSVFFAKYMYICNVGCGGNSITLCLLPPLQQQLNVSCGFKFLLLYKKRTDSALYECRPHNFPNGILSNL